MATLMPPQMPGGAAAGGPPGVAPGVVPGVAPGGPAEGAEAALAAAAMQRASCAEWVKKVVLSLGFSDEDKEAELLHTVQEVLLGFSNHTCKRGLSIAHPETSARALVRRGCFHI